MHIIFIIILSISSLCLSSCMQKGVHPEDPYEVVNRKTHQFNMAFDATFLKPLAKLYKFILPDSVRVGINNIYNNINILPTAASDLLQGDFKQLPLDFWRFTLNSTVGLAGIIDVADTHFHLPPHSNDLGLTFARWGDMHSPYIVLPFLGPATIRDGMGILVEYTFLTPYPYIQNNAILYGVLGLRYIDLRSQLFDTEKLMDEAIDPYAFVRDVYLQRRQYQLKGEQRTGTPFVVDDDLGSDYVSE